LRELTRLLSGHVFLKKSEGTFVITNSDVFFGRKRRLERVNNKERVPSALLKMVSGV